jgi:hypothetical protein
MLQIHCFYQTDKNNVLGLNKVLDMSVTVDVGIRISFTHVIFPCSGFHFLAEKQRVWPWGTPHADPTQKRLTFLELY